MLVTLLLTMISVEVPTVTFGRVFGDEALPSYDKGYLLFQIRPNTLEVWNPQGQLQFRRTLAECGSLSSLAVDTDGTIAVNCFHLQRRGIVFVDRTGKTTGAFDTGRYMPSHIGFNGNHELWTFGGQRDAQMTDREDSQDYLMFRKWSRDGKQLAAFVERSKFPRPGLAPGGPHGGLWRLRVSGGWVGAQAEHGKAGANTHWIQFRENGSDLTISRIAPEDHSGIAFSSELGLCRLRRMPKSEPVIERFDIDSGRWKIAEGFATPVNERGEPLGLLLGADRDALVFDTRSGNIRLAYWKRGVTSK